MGKLDVMRAIRKNNSVLNVFYGKNKNSKILPIVIIVDTLMSGVD